MRHWVEAFIPSSLHMYHPPTSTLVLVRDPLLFLSRFPDSPPSPTLPGPSLALLLAGPSLRFLGSFHSLPESGSAREC